jgi:hypothetical protein
MLHLVEPAGVLRDCGADVNAQGQGCPDSIAVDLHSIENGIIRMTSAVLHMSL